MQQPDYGKRWLAIEGQPELLFTENETNTERLFNSKNRTKFVKDAIDNYVVHGMLDAVNPGQTGTKVAAHFKLEIPAGGSVIAATALHQSGICRPDRPAAQIFNAAFDQTYSSSAKRKPTNSTCAWYARA